MATLTAKPAIELAKSSDVREARRGVSADAFVFADSVGSDLSRRTETVDAVSLTMHERFTNERAIGGTLCQSLINAAMNARDSGSADAYKHLLDMLTHTGRVLRMKVDADTRATVTGIDDTIYLLATDFQARQSELAGIALNKCRDAWTRKRTAEAAATADAPAMPNVFAFYAGIWVMAQSAASTSDVDAARSLANEWSDSRTTQARRDVMVRTYGARANDDDRATIVASIKAALPVVAATV